MYCLTLTLGSTVSVFYGMRVELWAEFQCDLSEKCAINSRQIDFLEICRKEIAQDIG